MQSLTDDLRWVNEIKEVFEEKEVNQLLQEGWALIGTITKTQADFRMDPAVVYTQGYVLER